MAVLGCPAVYRLDEIQLLHNNTGSQIKILLDDLNKLVRAPVRSAVSLNEQRQRLRDSNGIGELHKGTTSQFGMDEGFGDPACKVRSRSVNF